MQHLKTAMLSLKVLFVSVAVIFTALGVKAFLPLATTHLPLLWTYFLLCFTPPYLFVTVNAIIISILASSRFHFHHSPAQPNHPTPPPVLEVKAVLVNGPAMVEEEEAAAETKEIDPGTTVKRMDSLEIPPAYLPPVDKPLVSAKFSNRKPPKSSPEGGRALRVAKAKRHETLENTWKAIAEGRSMPLSRHMKKCDTWQNRDNTGPPETEATTVASDGESETFDFKVAAPAAGKLRKEPSLSQDELNRRVEAFIHKFNQQMRLQRQESLNHYMQMINRGAS